MHGQAKEQKTAAEKEKKRKQEEARLNTYKTCMGKIFSKRRAKELDEEALSATEEVLTSYPDYYTLWNFRKEILLYFDEIKEDGEMIDIVKKEMQLTERCLRENPKSYCGWHHRLWLMDYMPGVDLRKELQLCTRYLKLDERNFHCWDYRRSIVERLKVKPEDELKYTMTKVEENFSNYSSWHYRSKLLPLVNPDPEGIRQIDETTQLSELEMVTAAAYTDPYDQSAWFYQRWLLGREDESRNKKVLAASLSSDSQLSIAYSKYYSPPPPPFPVSSEETSSPSSRVTITKLSADVESIFRVLKNWTIAGETLEFEEYEEELVYWAGPPKFKPYISAALHSTLEDQLASADQLLSIEPDTKWTLLISVLLMQAIDRERYGSEMLNRLDQLISIDPYRTNYYLDLRSRWKTEEALEAQFMNKEQVDTRGRGLTTNICLSGLGLTRLYHMEWLYHIRELDLSKNKLTDGCLKSLDMLYNVRVLILDDNLVTTLLYLPRLPRLEILSLRNNPLANYDDQGKSLFLIGGGEESSLLPRLRDLRIEDPPTLSSSS